MRRRVSNELLVGVNAIARLGNLESSQTSHPRLNELV